MLLLTGIRLPGGWKLPAVLPPFVEGTLGRAAITWTAQRKEVKTKDENGIMTCRSVQAVATALVTGLEVHDDAALLVRNGVCLVSPLSLESPFQCAAAAAPCFSFFNLHPGWASPQAAPGCF